MYAGALVTGPLTGGSFNPARTFGPALVGGIWSAHWIYWIAPVMGMTVTMHLYQAFRGKNDQIAEIVPTTGTEGPV